VGEPSNGSVAVGQDGALTYTPAPDFSGTDSFTYLVSDGAAESPPATVTVTVVPVNDAPVAAPGDATTEEETATGWTPRIQDDDGDRLRCWIEAGPSHGAATVQTDCLAGTYSPVSGFTGRDTFTYGVSDGELVAIGRVTVVVGRADH
jgi:hypothetical protein